LQDDAEKAKTAAVQTKLQQSIRMLQSRLNVYLGTVRQLSSNDQELASNINKDVLKQV
jgi:hypothetical protein